MKGVILAGGRGTRLWPVTKVVGKHFLPVGDKTIIHYPILTLKKAGIKDILIVCGQEHTDQYVKLLGSGAELGVNLYYTIQVDPLGIAHGLGLARSFAEGHPVALILGDNIFGDDLSGAVKKFSKKEKGSMVILKQVPDPKRFGVASFRKDGTIKNVVEKPQKPATNWAVTGFYLYDNRVFDIIKNLKPSARGEYEITDVNNWYINEGTMDHFKAKKFWVDAGTFDSLHLANILIRKQI
ncbi:MAG: NTP transferase domain-containing protein [Candidatus Yanofskybacteria bacterium]|nr:NTP transferase domain-containing protein [Candidatus Yanofskybacteria bacterium]